MQHVRLLFFGLLGLLLLGFGLLVGFGLRGLFGVGAPVMLNTATVLRQVQTLSQLVTVKYVMEKVVARTVPAGNPIGRAVGSEDRVLLVAHGIVKAGVDLSALQAEDVRIRGQRVTVRLPASQITDAYLDEQQTKVLDRSTGLFTSFDKNLEQDARAEAVDAIRRAARNSGIIKDADERARLQLTALFHQMGFEEVEFVTP
jgi:hypothetical protein